MNATSEIEYAKMRSPERTLIFKAKEGKNPIGGVIEGNIIKAVMDESTCLWSIHYEKGTTPGGLRQHFTSFGRLLDFAKNYYGRRNLDIVEVRD